jgi:hypothetical protein
VHSGWAYKGIIVSEAKGNKKNEAFSSQVAKIFMPLLTTKSKGQGFGLAVVKKLAEVMGGPFVLRVKRKKTPNSLSNSPFLKMYNHRKLAKLYFYVDSILSMHKT